ncbi:hypothetical protein G9A89_006765 [Geosiphon pyriformis]|nr:hypothetical protein G9A89_006765 [Geosiphon pyriformis]
MLSFHEIAPIFETPNLIRNLEVIPKSFQKRQTKLVFPEIRFKALNRIENSFYIKGNPTWSKQTNAESSSSVPKETEKQNPEQTNSVSSSSVPKETEKQNPEQTNSVSSSSVPKETGKQNPPNGQSLKDPSNNYSHPHSHKTQNPDKNNLVIDYIEFFQNVPTAIAALWSKEKAIQVTHESLVEMRKMYLDIYLNYHGTHSKRNNSNLEILPINFIPVLKSEHLKYEKFPLYVRENKLLILATQGFGKYTKSSPPKIIVKDPEIITLFTSMAQMANIPFCKNSDTMTIKEKGIIGNIISVEKSGKIFGYFRGPEMNAKEWARRKSDFMKFNIAPKGWSVDNTWAKPFLALDGPFATILSKIIHYCEQMKKVEPEIYLTGHGIGGVYALYVGILLHGSRSIFEKTIPGQTRHLTIVTFGQPRPGNEKLAQFIQFKKKNFKVYRVTNKDDMVPHYPIKSSQGKRYSHVGSEYWISDISCDCSTKNPKTKDSLSFALYECPSVFSEDSDGVGENMNCNLGTLGTSTSTHYGPYFGTTFGRCEDYQPKIGE